MVIFGGTENVSDNETYNSSLSFSFETQANITGIVNTGFKKGQKITMLHLSLKKKSTIYPDNINAHILYIRLCFNRKSKNLDMPLVR